MRRKIPFHSNAVWPTLPMTMFFVIIYGIIEASFYLLILLRPASSNNFVINDDSPFDILRAIVLGVAAGVYAIHRIWRFHPVCNQAYSKWLRLTPWTSDQPLPLGPIHLVWQDAAVIGLLSAVVKWHAHSTPLMPVIVFASVYFGILTLLLIITRRWWSCLLLGFLWPALALSWKFETGNGLPTLAANNRDFQIGCGLLVVIIGVIWWGHRQSLKTFPWNFVNKFGNSGSFLQTEIRAERLTGSPSGGNPFNVGWPFLALSPRVKFYSVPWPAAIALGALFGWWSFCFITVSQMDPVPELILVFAVCCAVGRLLIYCSNLTPSFNVLGRLSSGRLIVPGFDQVFVTPLAAILVAIGGGAIIERSGKWYPAAESMVIALMWYVIFAGGPNLQSWIITGWHRFKVPRRSAANKQLQPI